MTSQDEKMCINGCGLPICPPSEFVCRKCLARFTADLEAMARHMAVKECKYCEGTGMAGVQRRCVFCAGTGRDEP